MENIRTSYTSCNWALSNKNTEEPIVLYKHPKILQEINLQICDGRATPTV